MIKKSVKTLVPIILGLTGGIATGKSTVLTEYKKLGARIIDADLIAHRIIRKGTKVYKTIINKFGKYILKQNREIDRKKLAGIIFSNSKKRKLLEKITHPEIIKEIKNQIKCYLTSSHHLIVLDAPLLFEKKLTNLVDKTLLVWVPKKIQIKRLVNRDEITRKEAIKRISAQMPLNKKKRLSDYIIDNSKPLKNVRCCVREILKKVL